MADTDIKKLYEAAKAKDSKKLKANPIFLTQFFFSFITLVFCMGALISRRFKDNETILWSLLWGILGTYCPTAHMDNKPAPAPSSAPPPLTRERENNNDQDYDMASSNSSINSVSAYV